MPPPPPPLLPTCSCCMNKDEIVVSGKKRAATAAAEKEESGSCCCCMQLYRCCTGCARANRVIGSGTVRGVLREKRAARATKRVVVVLCSRRVQPDDSQYIHIHVDAICRRARSLCARPCPACTYFRRTSACLHTIPRVSVYICMRTPIHREQRRWQQIGIVRECAPRRALSRSSLHPRQEAAATAADRTPARIYTYVRVRERERGKRERERDDECGCCSSAHVHTSSQSTRGRVEDLFLSACIAQRELGGTKSPRLLLLLLGLSRFFTRFSLSACSGARASFYAGALLPRAAAAAAAAVLCELSAGPSHAPTRSRSTPLARAPRLLFLSLQRGEERTRTWSAFPWRRGGPLLIAAGRFWLLSLAVGSLSSLPLLRSADGG